MFIFDYHDSVFCAESVPLTKIADDVGTPFYCYSLERLRQNYKAFTEPFADLHIITHYAVKANANLAVIQTLAECGAGADVTSAGELERALQAGIRPDKIVFNGVGKTRAEIASAIRAQVYQLNVESIPELYLISQVSLELELPVPIALRINPDIDVRRHNKPLSGHNDSKFGIDITQLAEAIVFATTLPGLQFKGLAVHVGAQVYDYESFSQAYQTLASMVRICRAQGVTLERIDLGGGAGISHDDQKQVSFSKYAAMVCEIFGPLNCTIMIGPGCRLVGDAGVLVTRVTHVKKTPMKNFLVVDAGMNDFICPALYGARHGLLPVIENQGVVVMPISVVGPVCESRDLFGENYFLPPMVAGDLIAVLQAGAYGSSMASTYTSRPLVPEVIVSDDRYAVVRRRISIAEQMSWEVLPPWMAKAKVG